jgi:hypothetical protein
MLSTKTLLITLATTSTLYVAFAATVPTPEPDKPLTTRQKIAKYIKPKVVDKALDKLHDKAVDLLMYEGSKYIGGCFRGGDEDATREILSLVTDPRQWGKAPYKVVRSATKSSQTASQMDDGSGANGAIQATQIPYQDRQRQQAQQEVNTVPRHNPVRL